MDRREFGSHKWRGEVVFDGETFEVHSVPGWLYTDWVRLKTGADDDVMADLLYRIFATSMDEDTFERFRKFAASERGPDMQTLVEAMQWMAEQTTERPTKPSSPSAPGRRRAKAAAGSSGPASKLTDSTSENSAT